MMLEGNTRLHHLKDLLHYMICGSFRMHTLVVSDYELSKSTASLHAKLKDP